MEMTKVQLCEVDKCSYNWDNCCHAFAITIGDDMRPMCDTFFNAPGKGGGSEMAGVGACKVSCCTHNERLECNCSQINVGYRGDEIDCMNYEQS